MSEQDPIERHIDNLRRAGHTDQADDMKRIHDEKREARGVAHDEEMRRRTRRPKPPKETA